MSDINYNRLVQLFGKETFVFKDIPERFFYDESTVYYAMPDAVFLPRSTEELSLFIRVAVEEKFNIVPRGMGTGVCGGAVAVYGGVVVSLERLKEIIDFDESNMCITVQSGAVTGDIKTFLEKHGYYYPPDPQSYESSSIGGNVATNAGGPRAIKYGTTKNYIMALNFITGSGEQITTGGKIYKFSSGYNLNELFCGSEGTLGIVTEVTLKFLPMPLQRKLLSIPFKNLHNACNFLKEAIKKRVDFSAFEFIDDTAKFYVEKFLKRKLNYSEQASCYIFAELEGEKEEDLNILLELASLHEAMDIYIAKDKGQEERIWEARRKVSEAFKCFSKNIYKADIVVPRGYIADFLKEVKKISQDNIPLACFGHVGDGNVHINLLDLDGGGGSEAKLIMQSVMDCVKRFKGYPSGEHGIGVAKKEYLKMFFSKEHIELTRKIKKVFDPYGIMNKGKIF